MAKRNESGFKSILKYKILKPCFNCVYSISPDMAVHIRDYFYRLMYYLRSENICYLDTQVEILIDASVTSKCTFTTGIQRVVKNIISNLDESVIIGTVCGRKYQTNFLYHKKLQNKDYIGKEYRIDFKGVKKLVLLDSAWENKKDFTKYLNEMCQDDMKSYAVVYDLLPQKYPEFFGSKYFIDVFTKWHNMILTKTDHIMCISKAVADDVVEYCGTAKIKRDKPLSISYFPLGADLPTVKIIKDKFIRNKIKNFVSDKTFLMVGTIEPRKGHLVALEAFTKRLEAGNDIKLLIIGRNGWKNEEFINLLSKNKYYGKNILWLDDANDIELAWCYQHTCCLIAASKDEGYGLPLIEAAHYGVPIICSDIPVFREVAQGYADYFKVWDSGALADTIKQWLNSDVHPDSRNIKIYSWAEATKIFMEIVNGEREPYKVIQ